MPNAGGFLYAIGAEGTTLVKIGFTKSVETRLETLQSGHPLSLRVLASIAIESHPRRVERQVHAFLAEDRRQGEWFDVPMDEATLAALVLRALAYLKDQEAGLLSIEQNRSRRAVARLARLPTLETSAPSATPRLLRDLGTEIRKARFDKGWQQQDLRDATGLHQKYLSLIELGKVDPKVSIVQKIAAALGVSVAQLLKEAPLCP